MSRLRGERIAVVGATGVLGQAIVLDLLAHGADVLVHGRDGARLAAIVRTASQLGTAHALPVADLTSPQEVDVLAQAITAAHPSGIVFAQGRSLYALVQETDEDEARRQFELDIVAPLRLVKAALTGFLAAGRGRIVFLGSIWGALGASREAVYSASKSSVHTFAKSLAKELAPAQITVNVVAPGPVDSPMLSSLSAAEKSELAARQPFGRMVAPADVAHAVRALLDPDSTALSGQILFVGGPLS